MAEPRSIKDELTPLEAALDSLHSWFTFTREVEEMVVTFLEQEGERQLPSSCAAAMGVMCSHGDVLMSHPSVPSTALPHKQHLC
jgi:hypothetical protein